MAMQWKRIDNYINSVNTSSGLSVGGGVLTADLQKPIDYRDIEQNTELVWNVSGTSPNNQVVYQRTFRFTLPVLSLNTPATVNLDSTLNSSYISRIVGVEGCMMLSSGSIRDIYNFDINSRMVFLSDTQGLLAQINCTQSSYTAFSNAVCTATVRYCKK